MGWGRRGRCNQGCAGRTERRPEGGGARPRVREGRGWGRRGGEEGSGRRSREGFVTGPSKRRALGNLILRFLRSRKSIFFWKANKSISKKRKDVPVP